MHPLNLYAPTAELRILFVPHSLPALQVFPERVYDVGIAEQHAVTFAAGLACEGLAPFVAIYSSFLQRGYDQVVHDVSLQNLPGVRIAAGLLCVCCTGMPPCLPLLQAVQPAHLWATRPSLPQQLVSFVAHTVRFAMDRAGLVGADGATHCGAFDVTYMACLPNMVVMAPSNEAELINMVATCAAIDDRYANVGGQGKGARSANPVVYSPPLLAF